MFCIGSSSHHSRLISLALLISLLSFAKIYAADAPPAAAAPSDKPASAPSAGATAPAVAPPPAAAPADDKNSGTPAADASQKPDTPIASVVVTAERVPTPTTQTGVSVTVVDGKEEDKVRQVHDLSETLRQVPGITVSQSGRQGDFTSIFTRGGNSNQTLLLQDGFKVNRQGGNFDAGHLDPILAERIEIARGPASALFGTDAVTGAVNVVTAKGEGKPDVTVSGAGGTYGTDRETFNAQGTEGKFSYNIGAAHLNRHDADYINSDLEQYSYAARLDFDFNCDHTLKAIVRGVEFGKGLYENSASGYGPAVEPQDPNDRTHTDDLLTGLEYKGHILPIWDVTLKAGNYLFDTELVSIAPNPTSPILGFSQSEGQTFARERRPTIDFQNDITAYSSIDEKIKDVVSVGTSFEQERYHQTDTVFGNNADVSRSNWSVFLQNRLSLFERAFITGGVRREQNQQFGEFTTGRGDVAILIPESDTRIHGSVGNAFRAPSFFEFFSSIGNPDLQPEKNLAYDAGVEQNFLDKRLNIGVTAFRNNFKDLIDFSLATSKFSNLKTAQSQGLEFTAGADPIRQFSIRTTATLLHTEDQNGLQLARRPNQTFTAQAIGRPIEGLELSLTFLHEGARSDIGPTPANPFARINDPSYSRFDAAATYSFKTHWRAFGRIQNLLNEHYNDVSTFPAAGANVLAGIEFNWKF